MHPTQTLASRTRRRVATLVAAVLTGLASLTFVAAPAEAASWIVISKKTSCHTYSFGTLCTVTTTKLRNVSYCTRPPINDPWGSITWATYCVRYSETTYWK